MSLVFLLQSIGRCFKLYLHTSQQFNHALIKEFPFVGRVKGAAIYRYVCYHLVVSVSDLIITNTYVCGFECKVCSEGMWDDGRSITDSSPWTPYVIFI